MPLARNWPADSGPLVASLEGLWYRLLEHVVPVYSDHPVGVGCGVVVTPPVAVALDEGAGPEVPVKEDVSAKDHDIANYDGSVKNDESDKDDENTMEDESTNNDDSDQEDHSVKKDESTIEDDSIIKDDSSCGDNVT